MFIEIVELLVMIGVVIGVICELYHFWHKSKPMFFYIIGFLVFACAVAYFFE